MSAPGPERLRGALGPVKQIAAGVLDVGVGPPDVFVAAFAPDEAEPLGEMTACSRDSVLGRRRSRCGTRLRTARGPPQSPRSIPRSSTTCSPPTCRRSRPP